jgi:hypothetical protein
MKHRIDLKLCNICSVGDHSLEEFPIVLEKIMTRKNVNLLHAVSKEAVLNSNNLNIITRYGTGRDINNTTLHDQQRRKDSFFPNPDKEEQIMKESIRFFKKNIGIHNEDIIQEFLQLLHEKQLVGRLLELLNILKEYKEGQRPSKDGRQLSYTHKYYDPRVYVEINEVLIKQVVFYFGSQVNILPRETWIRLGQLSLAPTLNYLKLVDQRLIEPIGILRNTDTQIMGILTQFEYEFITLVMGMTTYIALVGRPWGQKMKVNISLEKDKIKLKAMEEKQSFPWI